jgi:hypothetical protein
VDVGNISVDVETVAVAVGEGAAAGVEAREEGAEGEREEEKVGVVGSDLSSGIGSDLMRVWATGRSCWSFWGETMERGMGAGG